MTDKRPQTIQFFLPQGEPRGIRIADITTRIIQASVVPYSKRTVLKLGSEGAAE